MKSFRQVTSDALREAIKRSGRTKKQFEADIGFGNDCIYRLLRVGLSADTTERVCRHLNMKHSDFMKLGEE